jgi:hypothetical protein
MATQHTHLHTSREGIGFHSDACRVLCNICPRRPRHHHSLHRTTTEIDVLQSLPHTSRLIICAAYPPTMQRRRQARRPQDGYTDSAALYACCALCRSGLDTGVAGCVSSAIGRWSLFVRNADAGAMSSCAEVDEVGVSGWRSHHQVLLIPYLLLFRETAGTIRETTAAETQIATTWRARDHML